MALEFLVRNQRLKLFSGGPVVADSQQYLKARFTFTDDWQGLRKYAQFRRNGEVYTCNIDDNGEVEVPWETLVGQGVVQISAFATNQQDETNKLITTNPVYIKVNTSGIKETELPKAPSLGILGDYVDQSLQEITDHKNQVLVYVEQLHAEVMEAKEHIDQTDYKIYVGETAPTEDITNAMVWINPAEDDNGSDELAEAVTAAQNAATKAEDAVANLPDNWQDIVNKTDGFITPEMFGAVGDGIVDDTEAIQLSLDYMAKNNLLVLHLTKTYRITSLIKVNIQQLRIVGEHINNSCIYCDGTIAGLEIGDGNNECFEIVLDNFWIRGNNNNTSWLLSLNRCTNIYLTRFHISNGNKDDNGCLAYFNKANIVYIDKSVIEGGSNLKTTNASGNGLKISGNGSILDISRCNIWNLNNALIIEGNLSNFSFRENWCECIRSFLRFELGSVTDMRWLALNIRGNTFNVHNVIVDDFTLEINSFAFITFNSSTSLNFYMGKILLDNNVFYFDASNSLLSIENNSLIVFLGGVVNDSSLNIEFNNNVFSGKILSELDAYVYKNTLNITATEVYFSSVKTFAINDLINITDDFKLVRCGLPHQQKQRCWFPRGVNLSNYVGNSQAGELYYADGNFWIRYEDGLKMLPKKATQTISYATNDTILTELNKVITALAQAGIASRVE